MVVAIIINITCPNDYNLLLVIPSEGRELSQITL